MSPTSSAHQNSYFILPIKVPVDHNRYPYKNSDRMYAQMIKLSVLIKVKNVMILSLGVDLLRVINLYHCAI